MKNFLTLTLSVIAFLSISIQSAAAQDCSAGCRCDPPCCCIGIEDCGCACLNFKRDTKILERGEELGASRDTLEKALGYLHEFSRSSVIRRLVNEFLWGGCLEIIPRPENAYFEMEWKVWGWWENDGYSDTSDDWTGDMTKYNFIEIPFYDSRCDPDVPLYLDSPCEPFFNSCLPGNRCMTYVGYYKDYDRGDWEKRLNSQGYRRMYGSGNAVAYAGRRVIIDYYIRKREGKETEYVAVGDGIFKGWMVKMIRPAQVFGKSME